MASCLQSFEMNGRSFCLAGIAREGLRHAFRYCTNGFSQLSDHQGQDRTGWRRYKWQAKDAQLSKAFNTVMAMQKMARAEEWFEIFPVEERSRLGEDEKERLLLVDVGGGESLSRFDLGIFGF